MTQYNYPLVGKIDDFWIDIKASSLSSNLEKIDLVSEDELCVFTFNDLFPVEKTQLDGIYATHAQKNSLKKLEKAIVDSMAFGQNLLIDFRKENVLLGIVQDQMTGYVIEKLSGVMEVVLSGSLLDAIDRLKAVPVEDYDGKYITEARIIAFINKIETYLGLALTTEL